MSLQKNDNKTKKKLISEYQAAILANTLNNNKLISQIEDLKTTLNLNRNLLYCYIEKAEGENEKIKDLIKKVNHYGRIKNY